jgi:hypothetical protein
MSYLAKEAKARYAAGETMESICNVLRVSEAELLLLLKE